MAATHRICSFTERIIPHTDNSSVQLTFVELDENGRATSELKVFNVLGKIRLDGTVDELVTSKLTDN